MSGESFVIVTEIPSIKSYVFGTDTLNEVRGASAHLNRLNRDDMEQCLREHPNMAGAQVERIYANGGAAQFLVHGCDEPAVQAACTSMVRRLGERTGGDVRAVYGIAPLQDEASYRESVHVAHFRLRCRREFASAHRSAALLPTMMECQSASHLPATRIVSRGAEGAHILSEASYEKARHGRTAHRHGLWDGWMRHLNDTGPWPETNEWHRLRCENMTEIGNRASSGNHIGVIYADGNAMGQIVQALDRPETFRQFSRIVDESINEACFTALSQVSRPEVDKVREALEQQHRFEPLAADILLLGGDDLLVVVPADRALDFALQVTSEFERLTREKIAALQDEGARQFFRDRLGDEGFTISCGVAIAKSNYPFYLSLDLAEQLLKNAKRRDSRHPQAEAQEIARIDFHVVAGANSHKLEDVRQDTYQIRTDAPRTLRPLSCSQLEALRAGVRRLRDAAFPRSKLHELQEAALAAEANQADRRLRDIFARCRHDRSERLELWLAVSELRPEGYAFDFPWFKSSGQRLLGVADLVEAYDLLPK